MSPLSLCSGMRPQPCGGACSGVRGDGMDFSSPFPFFFLFPDVEREQEAAPGTSAALRAQTPSPVPTHNVTTPAPRRFPRAGRDKVTKVPSDLPRVTALPAARCSERRLLGQRGGRKGVLYPSGALFSCPPPAACARGTAGTERPTPGTEPRNSSTDLYTPPRKKPQTTQNEPTHPHP